MGASPGREYPQGAPVESDEIGHNLTLSHCDDYRCALVLSHAVEMD
jgi:hypothetical protein